MHVFSLRCECLPQIVMIQEICDYDEECIDDMLGLWGAEMREIITSYEQNYDRVPTADEIKWVMSERRHKDITENIEEYFMRKLIKLLEELGFKACDYKHKEDRVIGRLYERGGDTVILGLQRVQPRVTVKYKSACIDKKSQQFGKSVTETERLMELLQERREYYTVLQNEQQTNPKQEK